MKTGNWRPLQVEATFVMKAGSELTRLYSFQETKQEKEGCRMYVTRHDYHRQHGPDFALHK